jgi:hypothetical protein
MRHKTLSVLLAAIFMVMMTIGSVQAATKTIPLVSGWNLINTPIQPTSTAIADVLDGISYASAWSWDAANAKWRVYLADEATPGSYAESKGFDELSTISAGEGVWVNVNTASDLTITGDAPGATDHTLVKGWNLIGSKKDESKTVSSVLSMLTTSGVNAQTLWSWDADNGTWDVAIPSYTSTELATYIGAKGFNAMAAIASTSGFWVNASDAGSVTETPPTVGKAYKTTGKNAYVALANAPVYVNGNLIGQTDSNGNFQLPGDIAAGDVITIGSGESFTVSASQIVDGSLYMFAQDQDTNKVVLVADSGDESVEKPTPKKITSSDGKASITITSMKLLKDITVAVTPYKTAISAPNVAGIKALDPQYTVVAGADVIYVDANGENISLTEAGFQGVVYPQASNFLGEVTGKDLSNYVANGVGALHLLQFVDGVWTKIGDAVIAEESSQGKPADDDDTLAEGPKNYYLKVASGVQPDAGLYPFVFAFKMEYLAGSIDLTLTNGGILYQGSDGDTLVTEGTEGKGVVIEESFGDPVKKAMVTADSADDFGATDAAGKATIKYVLPPDNPNIALIIKKDGYFDATVTFNVMDDTAKTVAMLERPETAAVGGNIFDTITYEGIEKAKVTLKNPIVLDKIADDGETIQVGLDGEATYTWEIRKQGADDTAPWLTVDEGLGSEGKNQITKTDIKTKLITGFALLSEEEKAVVGANPVGTYDVKITVSHPFGTGEAYVETAKGYLDITIDFDNFKTASISMANLGQVSVFGGGDIGFYYATVPNLPSDYDESYQWQAQLKIWDDANSDDVVDEGEVSIIASSNPTDAAFYWFIDAINLVQKNYLTLLGAPDGGFNDPAAAGMSYLEYGFSVRIQMTAEYEWPKVEDGETTKEKVTKTPFAEFDITAVDPLATLVVGKLQITPNTTMAFEAVQETDTEGDYLFSFLDPELSGLLGLYAAADAYKPYSVFLTEDEYPLIKGWITAVDLGLDPIDPPDGMDEVPDWIETFEGAEEAAPSITTSNGDWTVAGNGTGDIQWWLIADGSNGPANQGVDYPVLEENDPANLLDAFGGTHQAWFGSKTTWTFSDSAGNTSSGSKNGTLTSPVIDLTDFSFATLDVASWFEVESVDVAKWQYDQMKVMVSVVADSYPVTIGDYTFESATDYKIVAFLNPDSEPATQSAGINYSSGGNDVVPIWIKVTKNLNAFAGHKIKLQFNFNSQDSLYNGWRGWGVDDVSILNADSGLPFTLESKNYMWKQGERIPE